MKQNMFPVIAAAVCLCAVLFISAFAVFGGGKVYDFSAKEAATTPDPMRTVYVSAGGSVYHEADCSYVSEDSIEMTAENAAGEGYVPCSRCGK